MAWLGLVGTFAGDPATAEKRRATRRKLRLESRLKAARAPTNVLVLDLSEAGLMFHADDELAVGEIFEVELPGAGSAEARVVWRRLTLYGCEFLSSVSKGTISALLLKAEPHRPAERKD